MPVKDGWQVCAEIRKWEAENPHVGTMPIVALTADVTADMAQKCKDLGFTAYCSKPIDSARLKSKCC